MRTRSLLIVLGLTTGCAPSFVPNRPRSGMVADTRDLAYVRDAIARAATKRHILPQEETPGRVVLLSNRDGMLCNHVVTYSERGFQIDSNSPPDQAEKFHAAPGSIDERCSEDADSLSRLIEKESMRPLREMDKMQRREERDAERQRRADERRQRQQGGAWQSQTPPPLYYDSTGQVAVPPPPPANGSVYVAPPPPR